MVLKITGRLTSDAVVRTMSQNKVVVSFSIAQAAHQSLYTGVIKFTTFESWLEVVFERRKYTLSI